MHDTSNHLCTTTLATIIFKGGEINYFYYPLVSIIIGGGNISGAMLHHDPIQVNRLIFAGHHSFKRKTNKIRYSNN